MCLKIGGWVRAEYAYGANGNFAWGWANGNVNNRTTNNRTTNNSTWRARGYITADARNQTEYGTVRGYLAVGLSTNSTGFDNAGNTFSANRAFIQWAGFTFGLAQSFFDFYSTPATSYWGSFPGSDTGDGGWMVAGYTEQFGNGSRARSPPKCAARRNLSPPDLSLRGLSKVPFRLAAVALAMAASRRLTLLRTYASTRLGGLPRSWARSIK